MKLFLFVVAASAAVCSSAETYRLKDFVWENKNPQATYRGEIPLKGFKPGMSAEVTMWVDASDLSEKGVPEASVSWGNRVTGSTWDCGSSTVKRWNDKTIEKRKVRVGSAEKELRRFTCRTRVMPATGVKPKLNFFAKTPATGRIVYSDIEVTLSARDYMLRMANDAYANAAFDGDVRFVVTFATDPDTEPDEKLVGSFVFTGADGRKTTRKAARLNAGSAEIALPVADLASGSQEVRFELMLDEKRLAETTCPFERLAKPAAHRVMFDKQGRTLVDGKPYFPIGMYWSEDTLKMSNSLERYAAPGVFNCLFTYEKAMTPAILDHFWAKGLMVMASVKDIYLPDPTAARINSFLPAGIKTKEQETAYVAEVVNRCKDHPALLAWYTCDEFDISHARPLEERYRLLKQLDPEHPVFVLAFAGSTRAFLRAGDATGMDCYPVGGKDQKPGMGAVWKAGDDAAAVREQCFNLRPQWHVPQAFKWQWDFKDAWEKRFPTRRELSSMTWQMIAAGANGIYFYSYGQMHWHTKNAESELIEYFDETTVPVARELKDVEEILLADPGPAVKAVPAYVRVRTWRKGESVYALVCNCRPERRTGEVVLEGAWTSCEPVFGAGVSLKDSKLLLDLKPIATAMVKVK